jgi:cytochrome c553
MPMSDISSYWRCPQIVGWAKRSAPTVPAGGANSVGTARSAPLPTLRVALPAFAAIAFVASPAIAADAAAGKQKAQMCVVCHGLDGLAKVPDAPNLAGESVVYTTRQLQAFRSGERKHEQMSIIAQGLSDEDIADLAAWYASVKVTVEMPN